MPVISAPVSSHPQVSVTDSQSNLPVYNQLNTSSDTFHGSKQLPVNPSAVVFKPAFPVKMHSQSEYMVMLTTACNICGNIQVIQLPVVQDK